MKPLWCFSIIFSSWRTQNLLLSYKYGFLYTDLRLRDIQGFFLYRLFLCLFLNPTFSCTFVFLPHHCFLHFSFVYIVIIRILLSTFCFWILDQLHLFSLFFFHQTLYPLIYGIVFCVQLVIAVTADTGVLIYCSLYEIFQTFYGERLVITCIVVIVSISEAAFIVIYLVIIEIVPNATFEPQPVLLLALEVFSFLWQLSF